MFIYINVVSNWIAGILIAKHGQEARHRLQGTYSSRIETILHVCRGNDATNEEAPAVIPQCAAGCAPRAFQEETPQHCCKDNQSTVLANERRRKPQRYKNGT